MPKEPIFNIESSLKKAELTHNLSEQLNEKDYEIDHLRQEIEQLRKLGDSEQEGKQLEKLRDSLASRGLIELALEAIEPNPDQPRETFTQETIEILGRSLKTNGQQQPILVIERGGGKYFLFDGERRWRAAQTVGLTTLKAVVIPEPKKIHRQALLANLHRENLNNLDLAQALIEEITTLNDISREEIPRILNTVVKRLSKHKQMQRVVDVISVAETEQRELLLSLKLNQSEMAVLQSILSLQLNPASVNKNVFPTLGLFADLKEAVQKKGLSTYHALILQRISSEKLKQNSTKVTKLRKKLTNEIIEQKISVAETRTRVNKLFQDASQTSEDSSSTDVQKFVKRATELKIERIAQDDLKSLRDFLLSKIEEIDRLFDVT
jgi:ParB family chromosome partitioning protein